MRGHPWFGLLWFWAGAVVTAVAEAIRGMTVTGLWAVEIDSPSAM